MMNLPELKPRKKADPLAGSGFKNGTENGTEGIPEAAIAFLQNYKNKKRATAERIMRLIVSNSHITILEMTKLSGSSERTVKRYLKEFQEADVLRRAGSDTSGEWILS
jgi:predicted HTH transcriptional regulator